MELSVMLPRKGKPGFLVQTQPPPSRKMGSNKAIIIVIVVGVLAILVGLTVGLLWSYIFNSILLQQLILSPTSMSFSMWKETPIPMYLKIYLFNWTNPENFNAASGVKPNFVEMGPYVFKKCTELEEINNVLDFFREVDSKVNRVWNENNKTVTFQQNRVWHFEASMSNGSLSDEVTNFNPVAGTIAYMMRYKVDLMKKLMNMFMKKTKQKLTVTKTVGELLFDGYEDELLDMATKLNIPGIPYDKFGWFYTRNNSDSYDGTFNMNTGVNDIDELGTLHEWNYSNRSKYYEDSCGAIDGTLGDLWPPMKGKKTVSVFAPDLCASVILVYKGASEHLGLTGSQYVSDRDMLDNGTNVPSRGCFCKDVECQPSGAFNVSRCKFGAPAFISLPHFYLADESYRSDIDGMKPQKEKHQFSMVVEPTAGIPMEVNAKLQLNLLVQPDAIISIFKDVPKTFVPMLWFNQEAYLSSTLASQVKFMLILPIFGHVTFYGIAGIGILLIFIATGLYIRRYRRAEDNQNLISRAEANVANRSDG